MRRGRPQGQEPKAYERPPLSEREKAEIALSERMVEAGVELSEDEWDRMCERIDAE